LFSVGLSGQGGDVSDSRYERDYAVKHDIDLFSRYRLGERAVHARQRVSRVLWHTLFGKAKREVSSDAEDIKLGCY